MNIQRREFMKSSGRAGAGIIAFRVLALAGTTELVAGCSLAQDIENWIPVAIASMKSIELVLQSNGFPLSGNLLIYFNDVIAALNAVDAAALEYGMTTPAPVGALQKLQAAIKAVTDQLATFLSQLNLPGGTVLNLIIGLAGVVISTLMAFFNRLPAAPASANTFALSGRWRIAGSELTVAPVERTRRKFKRDFNGNLDSAKKIGVAVPSDAYLKVGFFEHF